MAQPAETFDTYDARGNREDLSDIIYRISPTETPFMSSIGRESASAILTEWQTDALAAVNTANAVIDGDDATHDTVAATTRKGNRTQISDKVIVISGTQEAVDKAGRKSEIAYQLSKKSQELKRDMEAILTGNQAAVTGDATTARKTGSLEAWLITPTALRGGGAGADGGHSAPGTIAAATDGTQRALSEPLVQQMIRNIWNQGGDPTMIMVGPVNKQKFSAFNGNSTRYDQGEDKRLTAAFDVYISDFGEHRVIPNRFSRDRTLFGITPELAGVKYLRSFRQHPLAKTGDSERRQLLVEYALCIKNELGHGCVADLTTS